MKSLFRNSVIWIALGCLLQTSMAVASSSLADSVKSVKTLVAMRIRNNSIHIDGLLNEKDWQIAPADSDFVQYEPNGGQPATEKTTVQVLYDDNALYVGVRAYDSEPDKVRGLLTRRDQESPCDFLSIGIDSYGDKRTAFEFGVNPAGIQIDALWSDDNNRDKNWDAVWEVATSIDTLGWTAEFRIPFSQLRFPSQRTQTWGFEVQRIINRKNEVVFWAPILKNQNRVVSLFGRLVGLENIPAPKRLHLLPYAVGTGNFYPIEKDNPFLQRPFYTWSVGGNLKYGLTSNLTVDLTINPDFGQVEADPSEFNLTAYESYFEEKRPFFMEGSNIFNYKIGLGDEGDMAGETLFYSRRIGAMPHYYPDVSDSGYVDIPKHTRILGAVKLTGKTSGWSIGILEALTNQEKLEVVDGGQRYHEIVEPFTNYFVARLQRDFRNGRSTIGGMVTSVSRQITNENFNNLNKQAFAGGVDLSHRWRNDTYQLNLKILGSYISGNTEAIQEAQESSARYFQRPDAKHVKYDPNRTSLSGFAGTLSIGKIGGEHWRWMVGGITRSPGFEVNDLGYMRYADLATGFLWVGYQEFNPGKIFRNYNINLNLWGVSNYAPETLARGANINGYFRLLNYWGGFIGVNRELPGLNTVALRGGPTMKTPGRISTWLGFHSDRRKAISLRINGGYSRDDQGFSSTWFRTKITVRPSGRFDFKLSFRYSPSVDDRQYVDNIKNGAETRYILGRLKHKTISSTFRLNYTVTCNLTIQFYCMPFISAGKYSHFKEVIAPRAAKYDERYQPYDYDSNPDFNFKQFRSNLVIRWEYRPGSVIYLVWSQGRTNFEEEYGSFRLGRDIMKLFDTHSENVVMIKINRWLNI